MFLLLTTEPVLADSSITNPNGKTSLEIRSRAGLTILIRDEGKDGTAVEKRMEYDEKGRLTREILGDGSSNIYFYDGYDRLTKKSSLSEEGEVLEECLYTYDSLGRVTEVECAEGTGSERTVYSASTYTYDALGGEYTSLGYISSYTGQYDLYSHFFNVFHFLVISKVSDFASYWKKQSCAEVITRKTFKHIQELIHKGDIVQYKTSKGWHHSVIITAGKKGNWKYCGHSNSRYDEPLSSLKGQKRYRIIRTS